MLFPSSAVYIVSVLVFLIIDITWVSLHARSAFEQWAQSVTSYSPGSANPRLVAAAIAYALLATALCVFVVRPDQRWPRAFVRGALLGLCLYGVFDFTNKGIFGDLYPWDLLATDLAWGSLALGTAAGIGAALTDSSS